MTVDKFLNQVRRRLRLVSTLAEIQHWAPTVLAVSVVWILAIRLFLWPVPTVIFPLGVGLVGLISTWARLRLDVRDAAIHSDRVLRSGEFISSAVELGDAEDPLSTAVRSRAQRLVATSSAETVVPVSWYPTKLATSAALVVAAIGLALWPGLDARIGLSDAEQALVDTEEANIEALIEAIEEAEIPEDRKADLTAALDRLLSDLAAVDSLDEAETTIAELQSDLESDVGEDHLTEKAAVQGLERELQQVPLNQQGSDAAAQLTGLAESLAADELSASEQEQLAERLEALADSQSAGSSEVSQALAGAAAGLRSGNQSEAHQQLEKAAAAHQNARDGVRRDAANSAVGAALGNAAARLQTGALAQQAAQARPGSGQADRSYNLGLGQGNRQGQAQGNGSGQGQGQGSGSGQGQGAGSGQGSGGQGGAGAGQISGVQATGQEQGGTGGQGSVGQGDASDIDGMDVSRATIYDYQPPDAAGVDVQAYLDGGTGDGSVVGRADTVTERGQSVVPFSDVLPQYLDQASQALEDGELPPATRSTVRRYFDGLAQEANQP